MSTGGAGDGVLEKQGCLGARDHSSTDAPALRLSPPASCRGSRSLKHAPPTETEKEPAANAAPRRPGLILERRAAGEVALT